MDFKEGVILRLNNPYLFEEEKDAPMSEYLYEYSLLVGGEKNLLFTERLLRSLGLLVEDISFKYNENDKDVWISDYGKIMSPRMHDFYNKLADFISDSEFLQYTKRYVERYSGAYSDGKIYLNKDFKPSVFKNKTQEKKWLVDDGRLNYDKDNSEYYIRLNSQDMRDINNRKAIKDYIKGDTVGHLRSRESEQMLRNNQRAADARIAANKARLAMPRN